MLKNTRLKTETDYDKNLKQLLGLEDPKLKVLERSHGLIRSKGKEVVSPIAYQRKTRAGWEKRLRRQFKLVGRKKST